MFHIMNMVIPSLILMTLVILSFRLPLQSGEKVSLVVTVLLAYTVFILIISEHVPHTSDQFPLIGNIISVSDRCNSFGIVSECVSVCLSRSHD